MMEMYFEGLKLEDEIKRRYKELAKAHHPDKGGCVEVMKEINNQYRQVLEGAYQKAGKSITEIEELLAKDEAIREKIVQISQLDGITVELCGRWIWVSGDTRPVRDKLKEAKFYWASKKGAWYWHLPEDRKKHWGKDYSMDEIRASHGSMDLKNGFKRERLA